MRAAVILFAIITTVCPHISEGYTFTGRVERVIDGDTIIVGTNRVRLAAIDAPELKEPFGQESKEALCDMILHRIVRVEWKHRGRYRRIIGYVYLDGEWINHSVVASGWAKRFRRYSRNRTLAEAERAAIAASLGIWTQMPLLTGEMGLRRESSIWLGRHTPNSHSTHQ